MMSKCTVAMIPLNQITLGERFREDLGEIDELVTSIRERGIIQPLAVMKRDNDYLLLAGGRRFAACERAAMEEIPTRIYEEELSEYEIRAIELAENFYRKDLTWEEEIKLKRKIHLLYQDLHGARHKSENEGWSIKDTSELLGKSKDSVRKDLALAEAYEFAPNLFESCKNKHDANKVLTKVKESMVQDELKRRAAEKVSADPQKKKLTDSFIIGDFFKQVKKVPNASIDFIEFDPPYSIDLSRSKRTTDGGVEISKDYNEVPAETYMKFISNALAECHRVMAANSWMVLWFGPEPWFEDIYNAIISAGKPAGTSLEDWVKNKQGLLTNRMVGIWNKEYGQSKRPEHNLANAYEMFFIIHKGRPALNKPGRSNMFTFRPVPAQQKIHPTERPIELIMELVDTFIPSGSRVLVPCLGSGKTLLAAHQQGMNAFGYELTEEYKKAFTLQVQQTL